MPDDHEVAASGPTPGLGEITALELALHRPEVRRSREAVEALLADGFLEIGASGRIYRRAEVIDVLVGETGDACGIEAADFVLAPLAPDAVLLTYRTLEAASDGSERRVLRSSIWTRRGGAWRLRFHQGTAAA